MVMLLLTFVLALTGCGKNDSNSYNESLINDKQKNNSITEEDESGSKAIKLDTMDTPYTQCFQNEDDTYSLYIFAAPIQYYDGSSYRHIDNTLIETSDKNFSFENKDNVIKTYYPKNLDNEIMISDGYFSLPFRIMLDNKAFSEAQLVGYKNIYGEDIKAILYKSDDTSVYLYSSNYGVEIETVYNTEKTTVPQIIMNYKNDFPNHYDNANNGYIALRKGTDFNDVEAIIHNPIIYDNNTYSPIMEANVDDYNDENIISYSVNKPIKIVNQSIVLYTSNMPDSCVYSDFSKNQYLSRFSYLGSSDELGEGVDYIRYRLDYFMKIDPQKVINTSYNFRTLSNGDISKYIVQENLGQWSSSGLSWKRRNKEFGHIETNYQITDNNYIAVDITDYSKKCFADETWMTESYGLAMSYDGDAQVLASSDNPMYVPYLKIDLNGLPEEFYPMNDINPREELGFVS